MLIIAIFIWGFFIGWVANVLLGRGSRPQSWGPVLAAGLGGSLVGGLLFSILSGDGIQLKLSGILGSIIGAVIILAVVGAIEKRKA